MEMEINKINQPKLYAAKGGGFRFSTGLFVIYSNHRKTKVRWKKGETNAVVTTTHLYQSRVGRNLPYNPHRYHQEKPATSGIYL